jgi:L-threonylcarbamoyladenylate synthase
VTTDQKVGGSSPSERAKPEKNSRLLGFYYFLVFCFAVPTLEVKVISTAAQALIAGNLVAFPTETVFGLGADATNPEAVAKIYAAKGRPSNHPLIVHVSSAERAWQWSEGAPSFALKLAEAFWPGPMALVLNRSELAGDFITGGQPTVAVRVPNHPVALELLERFEELGGLGVAAPSANRFGRVSPTDSAAVLEELGSYLGAGDVVLEGEPSSVGVESTIIDCTSELPKILRPGFVTADDVRKATGLELSDSESSIRVSGSLSSHYAPRAKVLLSGQPEPGSGLLAMSEHPTPVGVVRLASPENIDDYARVLYSSLRKADERGLTRVYAYPPEGEGLAIAIRDRLQRASH